MKALFLILLLIGAQAASAQSVVFEELSLPAAADFLGEIDAFGGLYSSGGDTLFVRLVSGKVYVTTDGGQHWTYATVVPFEYYGSMDGNGLTSNGCLILTYRLQGDYFGGPQTFRPPMPKTALSYGYDDYPPILCLSDGAVQVDRFNPTVEFGPFNYDTAFGKHDRIITSLFVSGETRFSISIYDGNNPVKRDTILPFQGRVQRVMGHPAGEFILIGSSDAAYSSDNGETWLQIPKPCNADYKILLGEGRVMCVDLDSRVRIWDFRTGALISERQIPFSLEDTHRMQLSHTGALLIYHHQTSTYWVSKDTGSTWTSYPNQRHRQLQLRGPRLYAMDGVRLTEINGTTETDVTGDLRTIFRQEPYSYGHQHHIHTVENLLVWGFDSLDPYFGTPSGSIYSTDAGLSWQTLPMIDGVVRTLFKTSDGRIGASGDKHISFYDSMNDLWQMTPDTIDSRAMISVQGADFSLLRRDEYFVIWNLPVRMPRAYGLWKRTESERGSSWTDIRPDMAFYQIGSYSDGRIVARGGIRDTPNLSDHRTLIHLYESADAGETWTQLTDEPSTIKFFHHDHDLMRVFRVNRDRWLEMHTEGVSIPLFQLNATEVPKNMLTFASNSMVFQTSEGFYGTLDGGSTWMPLHTPFDANEVDIANAGGHFIAIDRDALRLYRTPSIFPTSINTPASATPSGTVSVTTYPNPTSSMVAFQVNLPMGSEVEITLYDVLGRRVASIQPSRLPSGTHNLSMSMTHLANGVYVYSMSVGSTRLSGRIVRM